MARLKGGASMADRLDLGVLTKNAFDEALKERGCVNVLIAGKTGVGKTTLINAIFQGDMGTTGQGRPVTENTRKITKDGIPLSIFDTRGLEMAEYATTIQTLHALVNNCTREADPTKHIHIAWVCIAEDMRRVEKGEEELVKMLNEYMPVVAVITKARADQGFRADVQRLLPAARNVVRVRAIHEKMDDGHTLHSMGLKELVALTMELVPEGQRRAFAAAQKVDIDLKKRQAHKIVATASVSAAAVGATPIPFSDAALLIPIQISMIAGITATFGLSFNNGFLSSLVATMVTGAGATLTGRAIVAGLFKLVPGVGTLTGSLIAASTAAALTTAFGETYISSLELLFTRHRGELPTAEEVLAVFQQQYTQRGKRL